MAWFILPMMNLISRKLGKPFQRNIIFLCIYVAASQRRGVVDVLAAKETDKTNLAEGFEITGLGEFMAMALKADRVVTL